MKLEKILSEDYNRKRHKNGIRSFTLWEYLPVKPRLTYCKKTNNRGSKMKTEESEEILVRKAKKGDTDAFGELVKRYERYILNLVYRTLGYPEDAEDIAQETFIKAFTNIKKFKGESKFSTWLSKIAINLCMDRLRSRSSKEEMPEEGVWLTIPQSSYYDPEEVTERLEIQERIRRAVSSLPDELRVVFVLREFDDLSYEEISKILNIPIGTVESRLYRARMRLKNLLSDLRTVEEVTEESEVQ